MRYANLAEALREPDTDLRLFGKPEVRGERRLGVGLARADSIETAVQKALQVTAAIKVSL
jgi:phosphoribosylglycinamide formyltransferase 2